MHRLGSMLYAQFTPMLRGLKIPDRKQTTEDTEFGREKR